MAEKENMLQRNATCPDIFVFGVRILMKKKMCMENSRTLLRRKV